MSNACLNETVCSASHFDALARRLRQPLMTFFLRRAASPADAEEMVQEVFVRLLRRDNLFALQNLDGYVFETAANLMRDKVRRDTARASDRHDDVSVLDIATEAPSAEDSVAARQRLDRMMSALDTLSPRAQAVVLLRRFEDMSYAQISQRLGISVSAVEKHMIRAMEVLRLVD
ncbi:RNA polymerase sigma factor [Asticcacaulis sp.]|uniref:RNA polymerase sigma factor n=1 Tax=unclassified Asticcacaulis TaxID=2628350 RepID=UPI0031E06F7B